MPSERLRPSSDKRRQQPAKAGPLLSRTAGPAKVFIDNDDVRESKRLCSLCQAVLALLTPKMVTDLMRCGLPHVHVGTAFQMISPNLVAHRLANLAVLQRHYALGTIRIELCSLVAAITERAARE